MGIPNVGDQVRKAPTQALRALFAGIGKMLLAADRPQADPNASGPKHAAPGRRSARAEPAAAAATQRWRSLDETGNVRLLSGDELNAGQQPVLATGPDGLAGPGALTGPGGLAQPGALTGQDGLAGPGALTGPDGLAGPGALTGQDGLAGPGALTGPGGLAADHPARAPGPMRQVTMTPVTPQPLGGNVPVGASLVIHELPLPGYDTLPLASIRARLRTLDVGQLQALLVHEQKNAERPEVIAMIERRIEKLESAE